MSKIERFEELIAWQKARELTAAIYRMSRQGSFAKDFGLSGQIQRADFERGGRGEFHQFLSTAKGSCGEVRSQLYVALDVGYINQRIFSQFLSQAEEVGRIIGGLRASVQRQRQATKSKS